jgi:S-DNA-T family DNA segregation ATPase FtsK/SpoIIIE
MLGVAPHRSEKGNGRAGPPRPQYVTLAWSDRLARSITPVRDVSGGDDDAGLPGACRP